MIEIVGGITVMAVWAGFVLWGLAEMVLAEAKGNRTYSSPVLCLIMGAALGAGTVLFFKHQVLHYDTFGLAFLLLMVAGLVIWACGYSIRHPHGS